MPDETATPDTGSTDGEADDAPSSAPDLATFEDLIRVPNFHSWMDLRVSHVEVGKVTIVLPFREELIGNPQIPAIHGGILAGLIDLAGGAATFTRTHAPTPTIDLRIDYVRPALEKDTVAEAEIVNLGSTIAFVDVEVKQEGKLVATGRATYSTKNAKAEAGPDDIPIG